MACIEKIYSVSALVGDGRCNANCAFCAGKPLRPDAGWNPDYERSLKAAIRLSARYGGWSLSLTGAGEPTCDPEAVTKALRAYKECADQGAYFPNVNLFTNGILLGDKDFCDKWLPLWKSLGLTSVCVSVHHWRDDKQAEVYGVKSYPSFYSIIGNLKHHGLGARATLLLSKAHCGDWFKYHQSVATLMNYGFDNITSWPVGNPDGTRNEYTPSRWNLLLIRLWLRRNAKLCHGHVWGGGVYDYHGSILRITDYVTKHDPDKDFVRQLVVFQDGTVAYSWIKEGALCMK